MLRSLAAVTVLVPSYDHGLAFFRDVLGFAVLEDTRLSPTKRWTKCRTLRYLGANPLIRASDSSRAPFQVRNSAISMLNMPPRELPMIWDADFILGPTGADGADTYVLGEINVSSIFPMPDEAPAEIARRVANRLRSKL